MRAVRLSIVLACFILPIFSSIHADALDGVPVLMYHEFVQSPQDRALGETVMTYASFEEQMAYLAREGYTTLSMNELVEYLKGKREVPAKSVVLTFDDGWKSQLGALPTLEKYGMKASFWVITGDGYGDVYFNEEDLKRIDANPNWEVESHTVTHPWDPHSNLLTWLKGHPTGKSKKDVWYELIDSKAKLERILNRKITMLAWPCGWYNSTLIHMAQKAGYEILLTIIEKPNLRGGNVFKVRRFFINGLYNLDDFKSIVEQGRKPNRQLSDIVGDRGVVRLASLAHHKSRDFGKIIYPL